MHERRCRGHSSRSSVTARSSDLSVVVELRVDMVHVAIEKEGEGRNVLETRKVRRGADSAREHEELVEFVVAHGKGVRGSLGGSVCCSPALLHQCSSVLGAQLWLLHISQKLQKLVAVRMVGGQALAQRELEPVQRQVLLLVDFVEF